MQGYHRAKEFIATQGPLPDTEDDFWRMVWEKKSSTIIMLTKEKETDGKVSGSSNQLRLTVEVWSTGKVPHILAKEWGRSV